MSEDAALPAPSVLEQHRGFLEEFAEKQLEGYTKRLESGPRHLQRKEFNDPIWKTFILQPLEVLILDSPLLQRLRLVRQLGVAHWVYPGATHTRFEHSLGVVRQVEALTASINLHSVNDGSLLINKEWGNLLRLAALCHDIGHGVMSHVSENALDHFDESTSLALAFADEHDAEPQKPSEIAAYYLIGSPAFRRLLDVARQKAGEYRLPQEPIALMQKAIIGLPISETIPLLHELISGPFDADKLDYMPRDAYMSGIPVVTDVDRLIQKVRGVLLASDKLPAAVARRIPLGTRACTLTGIALSGARTLDELMLGRTLLFDKIYRHQKVRTAEMMVEALLTTITRLLNCSPLKVPYMFSDDALIGLDMQRLLSLKGSPLSDEEQVDADVAVDLAERLQSRRFFVRAFAFATSMPLDPYGETDAQKDGLEEFLRKVRSADSRSGIVSQLCDEVEKILGLLNESEPLTVLPHKRLRSYVWLSPPDVPSTASDAARAYLIAENGMIKEFGDDYAETRSWTDAYPLTRDTGYVFAPRELAPYIFLAAEKLVREQYGIRIPTSMLDYAKQDVTQIDTLRRRLHTAHYYASSPSDLRPMPTRLTRADIPGLTAQIVDNLSGYSGPTASDDKLGKSVLRAGQVVDWLRQFDDDKLIEDGLCLLKQVRFVSRETIVEAIDHFIQLHPAFVGARVCPLGEPKDSSSLLTYFTQDLAPKHGLEITTLREALTSEMPILFVDDTIGSGGQAVTIVEAWLGAPATADLHEKRTELDAALKDALRTQKIAFVFITGRPQGVARLRSRLQELGLNAEVAAMELDLPQAFGRNHFASLDREEAFNAKCAEIGRALLVHGESDLDTARVQQRVLGYGNEALLVVFPYNTPAHTLTCLWKAGTVNGSPWTPLFPRRPKK